MSLSRSKKVYEKVHRNTRSQVKKAGLSLHTGVTPSKRSKKSKVSSFFAKPTFLGRTATGKVRKEKAPSLAAIQERAENGMVNNGMNALTSGFGGLKHNANNNIANILAGKMKL